MTDQQPQPAPEDPAADWRTPWQTAAEDCDYAQDLTRELRSAIEHGLCDPEDTTAVATLAAESTTALAEVLTREWALYTPQQAAAVASAVFTLAEAGSTALRRLGTVMGAMAERGHAPSLEDLGPGLRKAADQLAGLANTHAPRITSALQDAPALVELPVDEHETIAGVAALLGRDAKLNELHPPGDYEAGDSDGCGCNIDFVHDGEQWNFHRGDSSWSLTRESDGKPTADGAVVFSDWIELPTPDERAHPAHLVALIRAALPS